MGAILYGNMQWWAVAGFDIALNFSKKKPKIIIKIAKVSRERKIDNDKYIIVVFSKQVNINPLPLSLVILTIKEI